MRIIECYIKGFGKIKDKKISFGDGLCSFIADNGEGKSTVAAFIKAMLYGLGDSRKQSIEENDRKHYLPWDGSPFGGSMTFSAGGKSYRVERSFGKRPSDDTAELYDLKTGRISNDLSDGVGEGLFGIDAQGFEKTVFLSERFLPLDDYAGVFVEKLADDSDSRGASGILDKALGELDKERKFYIKRGGGGGISDLKRRISSLEQEIERLDDESRELVAEGKRLSETEGELSLIKTERQRVNDELDKLKGNGSLEEYETHLANMRSELASLESKKDSLTELFGGLVPTRDEIYSLEDIQRELGRLADDGGSSDGEYAALREKFSGKCDGERAEEIRGAILTLSPEISSHTYRQRQRSSELFSKRIPSPDELQKHKACYAKDGKKTSILPVILMVLGFAAAAAGILLLGQSAPIGYGCIGVGALLAVVSGVLVISASARAGIGKRQAEEFVYSVTDRISLTKGYERELLSEMEALVDFAAKDRLNIDAAVAKIEDFVAQFYTRGSRNAEIAARELLAEYDRLASRALSDASARQRSSDRRDGLSAELSRRLARFKLRTEHPISELREALDDYNRITNEIVTIRRNTASILALRGFDDIAEIKEKRARLEGERKSLDDKIGELSGVRALRIKRCDALEESLAARDEKIREKGETEERMQELEEELEVIKLASEHLTGAANKLTTRYLERTKESFEGYCARLLDDFDKTLGMDTKFATSVTENGSTHPTESYSRGQRDLFRFAARCALVDSLYPSEKPFILLDDPFVSFDDGKVKGALELLDIIAEDKQIIYMTCSKSRAPRESEALKL